MSIPDSLISGAFGLLGGGAFIGYVKDWRADKAKGQVAAATVAVDVDIDRLTEVEHRLTQLQRTWDMERDSLLRTVRHLEAENTAKDQTIAALTRRVEELDRRTTDNGS
ncbi:MAG TPA: hypothetical protein VIQ11_13040 [Mycobacterium sp.]